MEKSGQGWLVNGSIEAKLVVGAGGHFCPVARAIGSKGVSELAVAAKEIEKGYGWIFRKGDYLNIGLGREDKSKLSGHVANFCRYLKQQGKIPEDMPEKLHGHAYLLYPHAIRKIFDDHVLLIGDAVGLAYPQSGEGIRPAVESAMLAAKVIVDCQGDYQQQQLQNYQDELEKRFGKRQPAPDMMERLPMGIKRLVASQLLKTHWFTRNVVTDHWFLQSQQEPLTQK